MGCKIIEEAFEPFRVLEEFQKRISTDGSKIDGNAVFVGTMRDFNEGQDVESLFLEHYSEMAEKVLSDLKVEAVKRWRLEEALIVHRVGLIYPGEAIVLVATWAAHRAHAFESCRHIMEVLKSEAPFWKKERSKVGERWVTKNTEGSTEL